MSTTTVQPEGPGRRAVLRVILRDLWVYLALAFCCFGAAFYTPYFNTSDGVSYLDISDAIRHHLWHSVVNAYFFPGYPACLLLGRAVFGFHMKYELMAARITDAVIQMFFIASSVVLVNAVQAVMRSRGVRTEELISGRTLCVWTAIFAYLVTIGEMADIRPDALVSSFMILTAAAFLLAVARNNPAAFAVAGLCAALGEWTKAIACPFFILCLLCVFLANLRRLQVWKGLAVTLFVYAALAGPWIALISKAKGRLTFGDSGRLTTAWCVNGADVFNPVSDPSIYHRGNAIAHFKHAGTLLSTEPVAFYFNDGVYGSLPQWYDSSYWSDGLEPRFVLHDTLAAILNNVLALGRIGEVYLELLVLLAAPIVFGFVPRRESLSVPMLIVMAVAALCLIAAYVVVYLEGRYIGFSIVMFGALFAGCCVVRPDKIANVDILHKAVLLITVAILLGQVQADLVSRRDMKRKNGVDSVTGIFDISIQSAGAALHSHLPAGSEVACMGSDACFQDPYWARYAGMRITGIIDTSHGIAKPAPVTAEEACRKLEQQPKLLVTLQEHNIRAIVARFDNGHPCSSSWNKLGAGDTYFYRNL